MSDSPAPKRRKLDRDSLPVQTVYEDFTSSDDSDDSDAFEDIDLGLAQSDDDVCATEQGEEDNTSLEITLDQPTTSDQPPRPRRRAPLTHAEKRLRLHVHKAHVRCLFRHLWTRNAWCNDNLVKEPLRKLVPASTRRLLDHEAANSRAQWNQSFNAGLEAVGSLWNTMWHVTESGMRRSFWAESRRDLENQLSAYSAEPSTSFEDFVQATQRRKGSRDLAAQLYCALLRSCDVDTRLVCSLQPLPFSGEAKAAKPQKPEPTYARTFHSKSSPLRTQETVTNQSRGPAFHSPLRRLGLHASKPSTPPTPPRISSPRPIRITMPEIKDSSYPISWVEVFNRALKRWIPVDPLVRKTINKPKTGFEPPASDPLNNMSYVIAFEADFSAHDVTRRYTRHYNAKIRRNRVESTHGGEAWMKELLACYKRPWLVPRHERRDEDEAGELVESEEREEMPSGVDDFKGHPKYALERHLKRHEAIPPGTKKVAIFSAGLKKPTENVYRRQDVTAVRSAEQWYRLGKEIKQGEQPMKRAVTRKAKRHPSLSPSPNVQGDEEDSDAGVRLYAESQTQPYISPPVINSTVLTNSYGNLEIFTPSMVPAGAVHINHPLAITAAKILGISYAPAVTGFKFQGRKGTAVIEGAVVVYECVEAVEAVIEALEVRRGEEEEERKKAIVVGMWRLMIKKLRVKQRVREYEGEEGQEEDDEGGEDEDWMDEEILKQEREAQEARAVMVEQEQRIEQSNNRGTNARVEEDRKQSKEREKESRGESVVEHKAEEEEEDGGGFFAGEEEADESGGGGGFLPEQNPSSSSSSSGGGFLAEEEDDEYESGGGRFMMDSDDD